MANDTETATFASRPAGSLARKLILALVLIAVVPLAATVAIAFFVTSRGLQQQTGESVRQVAASTAELVSQTLVENVHLLETLAGTGTIVQAVEAANARIYDTLDGDPADVLRARDDEWGGKFRYDAEVLATISDDPEVNAVGAEIQPFKRLFPRHVELVVTDRHGGLLAATSQTQKYYFADEPWWQPLNSETPPRVHIGDPDVPQSTGILSVALALPIRDQTGELIGTLSSSLDIREVIDILDQVALGQTGVVRIYNTRGEGIFDPRMEGIGTSPLPAGLNLSGRSGFQRSPSVENRDAIHGYAQPTRADVAEVLQLGWTAVASQDAGEALAAVNQATLLQAGLTALVALLAIAVAYFLTRRFTLQLGHVSKLFEEIREENFTARAEVVTTDELGRMTEDLNHMLDNTLVLIQSREDRDRIQRAVVKLLEEVSDVARGDLTVRAEVTSDITGAIADSFNYMIKELRRIIGNVQDTTGQVSAAAGTIRARMEQLATGTDSQSRQIRRTSEQVQAMAGTIRSVSESATECSRVADRALHSARQGADAVEKTVSGMQSIRGQVREASKRLKRLGESSQEIGQIVQLIREISERTNILALNASLQAAAAGEVGESFSVVADEIERLAVRSAESSQRIETLIKTVQVETGEAMAAMEGTTREVVGGSQLATQAGQALQEIESVSGELAELVQGISREATQQAQGSELIATTMNEIAEVIHEAASRTQNTSTEAESLNDLAENLRESVRRFRLPAAERLEVPKTLAGAPLPEPASQPASVAQSIAS